MAQQPKAKAQQPKEVRLVAMVRDKEIYDEPYACDVHPDEVENYKAGGWVEAKWTGEKNGSI